MLCPLTKKIHLTLKLLQEQQKKNNRPEEKGRMKVKDREHMICQSRMTDSPQVLENIHWWWASLLPGSEGESHNIQQG